MFKLYIYSQGVGDPFIFTYPNKEDREKEVKKLRQYLGMDAATRSPSVILIVGKTNSTYLVVDKIAAWVTVDA